MNILITGAAGFVGSHLVDLFLKHNHHVWGVDNLLTGDERNLQAAKHDSKFTFIQADVNQDPAQYFPADFLTHSQSLDLILHFASPASPPLYQKYPVETYLVNSFGTHQLLNWVKNNQPSAKLLFASTSEVYGNPTVHPQPESYWGNVNPNGIRACYDESKRLGETICGVHARDFGLDVRIVRIFNTYGPRMNLYDGRVIPNFIRQALANEPLTIYGDGTQTRSYCYVDDLVRGIYDFSTLSGLNNQTINLGNDRELSTFQTAELIWSIVHPGEPLKFVLQPLPQDDPTVRRPDLSKANNWLNYSPLVSAEVGWLKTVTYFRELL